VISNASEDRLTGSDAKVWDGETIPLREGVQSVIGQFQ
jgi:hypothetical protein